LCNYVFAKVFSTVSSYTLFGFHWLEIVLHLC
jgi:hypothetical protein